MKKDRSLQSKAIGMVLIIPGSFYIGLCLDDWCGLTLGILSVVVGMLIAIEGFIKNGKS